ncbi:hypothetical protein AB0B86_28685 [Micromonospora sp. NPDC049047]|uniref:hypothetical protein n=1 Tax=Micromonospora sp. NPDC049047 TaxID=3155645 RepID=UPI0033E61253
MATFIDMAALAVDDDDRETAGVLRGEWPCRRGVGFTQECAINWRKTLLTYYVIYRNDERVGGPAGLFVMNVGAGNAILWDHRRGGWAVDAGLVLRFLSDYRNMDRYENVDRAKAEQIAPIVTGSPGLPDEAAFELMLANGAAGLPGDPTGAGGAGDQ